MQNFMRFFACEKNAKSAKINQDCAGSAGCAGSVGGKEGSKNPPGFARTSAKLCIQSVCMRKNSEMKVMRDYARVYYYVQHAAQGCGGFKRFAHSAGPI